MPFAPALLEAHRTFPRLFPPQLSALRAAIQAAIHLGTFGSISFIECAAFHYTPYHYSQTGSFQFGNSLPGPPTHLASLLAAFQWFISGLGLPELLLSTDMGIPLQAVGSHDCALFSYAAVVSMIEPSFSWLNFDVEELRARWVADTLKHHYHASAYQVRFSLRFSLSLLTSSWTGLPLVCCHA